MDLKGKIVAVTGASGFIGSWAAVKLLAAGAKVRGVVRTPDKARWIEARGGTLAKADLTDKASLVEAFRGADAILANAALYTLSYRSWQDFVDANVTGTTNTMQAAAEAGVKRVVYVSTCGVYRPKPWVRIAEDAGRLRASDWYWFPWAYPITKAMAEDVAWDLAKKHGLDLTVVRPAGVYGPRDFESTPQFEFWMKWPVLPAVGFRFPMSHVEDIADGMVSAIATDAAIGRAFNLSGEYRPIGDLLRAWKASRGKGPVLLPFPFPVGLFFDNSLAKQDLGFKNRPVEDTMRDIHAWIDAGRPMVPG